MAESADILSAPAPESGPARHGRRLLDGRHGRPPRSTTLGRAHRGRHRRQGRTGHLHELLGRLKAFCGKHGGIVCTSSNAQAVLEWAFEQGHGEKVLFFPDQHLGRNTACSTWACRWTMLVWNPFGRTAACAQRFGDAQMILWRGHCSVHGRFTERWSPARAVARRTVLVHPECRYEAVTQADVWDRPNHHPLIEAAPAGCSWAIGTEINLVRRLAQNHPDKLTIFSGTDRLPLRHDVPHRPAVSGLDGRRASRGTCGERHRGRSRHRALGQGRAPADARPARARSHRD